ncbi:levanase/fructan beta-fructosidase [Zhihengliuella halotolerans]|uniref:Levanase/fructan beta-fructosidase n=2 Tax=Zhihengliuella halotolerans TaxID=370736 RepID=A0A4V6MGF8_9MICC|nr:levanase/fructan beta-fructosidase [Zhihengliuella halotolerans]
MTDDRPAERTAAGTPRPRAHFTACDTWFNDPNGLLFHDGVYHLFFQNNPHGSTWGNMSWGHATSTDLVEWAEQPVAIPCTEDELVFSGSAVVDHHNTAGFAGDGETALVAIYTSVATDGPALQTQSLAYSLDAGATWTRYAANPVLDIGSAEFRDPKVFWHGGEDGHWVMLVVEATEHLVAVYTSPDLKDWTRASDFGPAHAVGGVWECPDLFPLRVEGTDETRWVLIVSLNPGGIAGGSGTQYFVGDFDGERFTAERLTDSTDPADYDWLDFGRDYYAAVSFSNVPDGRRLMIGWASNWDYANETPTAPWRSAMSLVREIGLTRTRGDRHVLRQLPVLPDDAVRLTLGGAADAVAQHDDGTAVLVFDASAPLSAGSVTTFVLDAADGPAGEDLRIVVDADAGTFSCDRTRSAAEVFHADFASVDTAPIPDASKAAGSLELRIVVDACVVEVYAAGGVATFTELVFPYAPYTRLRRLA